MSVAQLTIAKGLVRLKKLSDTTSHQQIWQQWNYIGGLQIEVQQTSNYRMSSWINIIIISALLSVTFFQHHLNLGHTQARIASALGRSRSTVSREVRRNSAVTSVAGCSGLNYDASFASQASFARRRGGLVRLAEGTPMRAKVFALIRLGWSPQQISGRLKLMDHRETVSHETIYQAIYVLPKGELRRDLIGLLRQGRKLRRPRGQGKDRRGSLSDMVSVHDRPASVLIRQLPGEFGKVI